MVVLSEASMEEALMTKGIASGRKSWIDWGVEIEISKVYFGKELTLKTCRVFSRKEETEDRRLVDGP